MLHSKPHIEAYSLQCLAHQVEGAGSMQAGMLEPGAAGLWPDFAAPNTGAVYPVPPSYIGAYQASQHTWPGT